MISGLLISFLGFGVVWFVVRHQKKRLKDALSKSTEYTTGAIATRIGLELVEGDPNLNLLYLLRPDGNGEYLRRVRLVGAPYGRHVEFSFADGMRFKTENISLLAEREAVTYYRCSLTMALGTRVAPFEVTLRAPSQALKPLCQLTGQPGFPEMSIGDRELDAVFRVVAADTRVAPRIADALRALAHHPFVHVHGHDNELRMFIPRAALGGVIHTIEEYVLAFETLACALEGRPAPVALAGSTPAGAAARRTTIAAADGAGSAAADGAGSAAADGAGSAAADGAGSAAPGAPQLVPIPCTRCGASMAEDGTGRLHGAIVVRCKFCGNTETLPPDEAERVRVLRLRLLQLRNASDLAEAPLRNLEQVRKSALAYLGVLLFVAFTSFRASPFALLRYAFDEAAKAPTAGALASMIGTLAPTFLTPSILVGIAVGYLMMLRSFNRAVRPLLIARPPLAPNGCARCRTCGGELAVAAASSVRCAYCQATNLLGPELTTQRAELLEREANAYRERARTFGQTLNQPFKSPTHVFYGSIAIVTACLVVLGSAASVLAVLYAS